MKTCVCVGMGLFTVLSCSSASAAIAAALNAGFVFSLMSRPRISRCSVSCASRISADSFWCCCVELQCGKSPSMCWHLSARPAAMHALHTSEKFMLSITGRPSG